jgi:hypothetical protein
VVASSCEQGNEPSGSIKDGEFHDLLAVLLVSQEGLCSMELFIKISYEKIDWRNRLLTYRPTDCKFVSHRDKEATVAPFQASSCNDRDTEM